MDGTSARDAGPARATRRARGPATSLCPHCGRRVLEPDTCVVCGAELGYAGGQAGAPRLTCESAECVQVVRRERSRADYRRRQALLCGRTFGPEVCPKCFYEVGVCRCHGRPSARRTAA